MVEVLSAGGPEADNPATVEEGEVIEEPVDDAERFYQASTEFSQLVDSPDRNLPGLETTLTTLKQTSGAYADRFLQSISNPDEMGRAAQSLGELGRTVGELVDNLSPEERERYSYEFFISISHLNSARMRLEQEARYMERRAGKMIDQVTGQDA